MSTTAPWRCLNCRQLRKHNVTYCCNQPWQNVIDHTFVHQPRQGQGQDEKYAKYWEEDQPWGQTWRSNSPRQRVQSPRQRQGQPKSGNTPRGKSRGRGKNHGNGPPTHKGKGKTDVQAPLPPPPMPWPGQPGPTVPPMQTMMNPAMMNQAMMMQPMPAMPMPHMAPAPSSMLGPGLTPEQQEREKKMQELMAYLKKRGPDLPKDVSQKVREIAKKDGAQAKQDLESAAKALGYAKDELEAALQAKNQSSGILENLLDRCGGYMEGICQSFSSTRSRTSGKNTCSSRGVYDCQNRGRRDKGDCGCSDRDQGRGGRARLPTQHGHVGKDHGEPALPDCVASTISGEGRRDPHRSTVLAEAPTSHSTRPKGCGNGCRRRTRWCQGLQGYVAFWSGRSTMTDMYGGQWPVIVGSASGSVPSIPKWTHSIIHEHNFKSEWQARETARGLAFEMASEGHLTVLSQFPSPSTSYVRRGSTKKVSFLFDDFDLNCATSNQHFSAVTVPGILKYKPNPADIAQLPDPAGPRDGAPHQAHQPATGSGNLLDRPYWQQQVWQRLQEEGTAEDEDNEPVFYMNSYFICHLTNRRQESGRPLRFDSDINAWEADMRFMWEDLVNPALPLYEHFVLPEPPLTRQPGTHGTLLLVQNPSRFRAACLTTVIEPDLPRLRTAEIAHSLDVILPFRHILFHAGVDAVCDARRAQGIGQCDILIGHRVLPHGDPVRLHEGLGLVIQVPPPQPPMEWENAVRAHYDTPAPQQWPDDDDTTSFLGHQGQPHLPTVAIIDDPSAVRDPHDQEIFVETETETNSTSDDEDEACTGTWRDTTVFTINGMTGQISLPWHRFHDFPALLRPLFGISEDEEVFAFSVDHPPADLDVRDHECLVVRTNLQPPSSHILRLILVDIEVYPGGEIQPTTHARRPHWMPHTANRLSIFRLLGLEEPYQEDQARCHLWVNRIWIDPEVDGPIHFDHGDSIIAIVADEQIINDLTSADSESQDSMSLFQNKQHTPIVCQSDHNITDFAMAQSNESAPTRPPQVPARHFVNGDWHRELRNRFLRHAVVEMEEEGPAASM